VSAPSDDRTAASGRPLVFGAKQLVDHHLRATGISIKTVQKLKNLHGQIQFA
jgi:hypothetical protein